MRKPPKKLAQRAHAKRRAKQRYGLTLNRHELRQVVLQIQEGRAKQIEKQGNGKFVFEVTYEGMVIPVVYDKTTKNVVTFLPTMLDELPELSEGYPS